MNIEIDINEKKKAFLFYKNNSMNVPVIIRRECFLELWRNEVNSIHSNISNGNEVSWREDYKYHWAEKGFSHGKDNPVPLADLNYRIAIVKNKIEEKRFFFFKKLRVEEEERHMVSFTNGITRTIWLMANGAQELPFAMAKNEAQALSEEFPNDVKILNV